MKTKLGISRIAMLVGGAFGAFGGAYAQQLDIATDPLGTGTTSIKPNVMFILDDSGSMGWDYMPDYVNDSHNPPSSNSDATFATAACFDSGDDDWSGSITGDPDACIFGDPPYNSPDLNTIYYNPEIRYHPGKSYDGSEMENQDAANTSNFTAVLVNPYQSTSRTNLAADYRDRVWCRSPGDSATGSNCRQNSSYEYPDADYRYGETSNGNTKYITGAPYYYRIKSAQYCDASGNDCRSGSSINPSVHTKQHVEYCTDAELRNCAAGNAVTASHIYSGVRWCADAGTLEDCQRKKIRVETSPGSGNYKYYIYPKHLGTTKTGTLPPTQAQGSIRVTTVHANGGTITGITIGGSSAISGPISAGAGADTSAVAALITAALNNGPLKATYTATQSGSTVLITANSVGTGPNGRTISVASTTYGSSSAKGRITIESVDRNTDIRSLTINGQELLCKPAANKTYGSGNNAVVWQASTGYLVSGNGRSNNTKRNNMRNALADAINTCAAVPPGQPGGATVPWIADLVSNYTIDLVAPANLGAVPHNPTQWQVAESGSVSTDTCDMGRTSCGGTQGSSSGTIATTTAALAGGRNSTTGTIRVGVGEVTRMDIVPANDSYPKGPNRSDCVGVNCTYAEEMTNFANWYAYYRTRLLMMKTAVGRAFEAVNESYRVGFITINPYQTGNISHKYLKVSDFTSGSGGHKEAWYGKLYSQNANSGTPLREALSRVGWLFGGKLDTGLTNGIKDDPITASCQPNFAILSTDGYWNGAGGRNLSNTAIGNQDNVDQAPYSLMSQGVFDGGTPVASDTLADVALYYYAQDLRTTLDNTVPTTNKDTNNGQHMVTFTLGLGLDGELTYRPDYETANSGDFFDIKQGTKKWPVPTADAPSALDDIWHAAVNGRGVFFSAKDPDTLASSLSETLNQLQARIGSGAAAATSNLQPVAGDNFAFTAQYQTKDWIGDLKARTIDLSSGIVASAVLWSAAELLDQTEHTQRSIFTYDESDTVGNKLKHFCMSADVGATWCNDGTGLTGTEEAYFDPSLIALSQESQWTTAGTPRSLVNYLRGEGINENTGASPRGATDLYRARISLLGDIVNAQPAYVKKSPFLYADNGYAGFRACTEGSGSSCPATLFPDASNPRRGTVYAASNDGMLHAFETDVNNNPYFQTAGIATTATTDDVFTGNNAGNGVERWAYIPGLVLPSLHLLANEPYTHRYFVDGSPQVGDICLSTPCAGQNDWRTILVAGLNSGGRGYYALDVTNPLAPKALWEFTYSSTCRAVGANGVPIGGPYTSDCHVGLSFGNPVITKRSSDGKWVVIVTSGYNNGSNDGNGDGRGYLYILDAATGAILHRLSTGYGTPTEPSGLAKINAWALNASVDNTVLAVYGGDLGGNLWRFDLDYAGGANPNYLSTTLIAVAKDGAGNRQPITVKPELGEYASKRIILFGTGQFLETADKSTTDVQTVYALRDEPSVVGTAPSGSCGGVVVCDVRGASVKEREFKAGSITDTRTVDNSDPAPNWSTDFGWYIDLPDSGERVNVDPQLQLGTLVVASNVPSSDTCTAGGYSYLNFLDYATGSFVPGAAGNMASARIGSSLTVGLNVVMLPGGKVVTIVTTADNQQLTRDTPVPQVAFAGRRVSWRELLRDQ